MPPPDLYWKLWGRTRPKTRSHSSKRPARSSNSPSRKKIDDAPSESTFEDPSSWAEPPPGGGGSVHNSLDVTKHRTPDGSRELDPILIRLGPIILRSYAILLYVGVLGSGLLVTFEARHRQLAVGPNVDAALAAGAGGMLLARAMYVGLHWGYYQTHISEALRLWKGGLAWQGAIIGGVIGTAVVCSSRGLSLPEMLDVFAPGAALVAAVAWLGCHAASCAYGMATYPGQGLLWELSLDLPDLYGIGEPRVAVQLLGAAWSAVALVGLLVYGRRMRFHGGAFAMWLALQSLGSFALGFWRADPMPQVMGWRVDQAVNLLLFGAGVVVAIAGRGKRSKHVNASSCHPSVQP